MKFIDLPFRFSLKKVLFAFVACTFTILVIIRVSRHHILPYFSSRCINYRQKEFSRKLSDKLISYSAAAKLSGIKACRDDNDIRNMISGGKLVRVKSNARYVIENMTYSTPCVTNESRILLDEIARRFSASTLKNGLNRARFIVTSMTRTTESMKDLRANNSNASANSPHLYGNTFDISYKRFKARKWVMTNCDEKFMKEALAEVIWQLRSEKRCWATYETEQNCFHVVCR